MAITDALAELRDEFDLLGDWEERYRYVIEMGKDLAPLTDTERNEGHKVRGCASQVWLVTEPQADGTLRFRGDSDAHIVRGLIAILLRLYSGQGGVRGPGADRRPLLAAFERPGLDGRPHPPRRRNDAGRLRAVRRLASAERRARLAGWRAGC
jgi:cysteine desulfuration protein SufE